MAVWLPSEEVYSVWKSPKRKIACSTSQAYRQALMDHPISYLLLGFLSCLKWLIRF